LPLEDHIVKTLPRRIELPRGRALDLGARARVMGILNLTPDSFFASSRAAADGEAAAALRMVEEGADILDLGGESTRPGSKPVAEEEQCRRVLPALEAIRRRWDGPISIDTTRAAVARRAAEAGADIVNDIGAARLDPGMPGFLADSGLPVILMHMQGTPETMQADPRYGDVVAEVREFLAARARAVEEAGVKRERILVDPGIGFGKRLEHNLALLSRLDALRDLGYPLVVGASRKSFLGKLLDGEPPEDLLEASLAVAAWSAAQGAEILRVHDVKQTRRVARVVAALAQARAAGGLGTGVR
jgi:dihydropteroate synthase